MNFFRKESGVYKCDKCNGTGTDRNNKVLNCEKCQGTGKLDWVEKVVGKRPSDPISLAGLEKFENFKLMVLNLQLPKNASFKTYWKFLKGFDIFLQVGNFSIPFLKTVVLLNIAAWVILYFGVKR